MQRITQGRDIAALRKQATDLEMWLLVDHECAKYDILETQRLGDLETWRRGDLETWRPVDVDLF